MSIHGIMGQSGIANLAREYDYAQRHPLMGPCSTRQMTDEEKERYGDMGARGPKPRVSRYCPECNAELKLRPEQLQQPTITCYKCTGVYDTEQLMESPKTARGGESNMPHEPVAQEPERKAATSNLEFEQAIQDMTKPAVDPDDEPILFTVVKPQTGLAAEKAAAYLAIDRMMDAAFDRGFEAGKAQALVEIRQLLGAM